MDRAMLEKIAQSQASQGGSIIEEGRYLFAVKKILLEPKFGGRMFIVELVVRESSGEKANKVGSTCSYILNLDKNASGPGNVKAFALALLGYAEKDVTVEDLVATLAEMTSAKQPCRGMLIGDETFVKPIKSGPNAGKPFVGHRWANVKQTAEEIAAIAKSLD